MNHRNYQTNPFPIPNRKKTRLMSLPKTNPIRSRPVPLSRMHSLHHSVCGILPDMRMLAAAILFAATLAAQDDSLGELASRARAAPPEFAADLLIQLAGRSESPVERRIEWLEDAFRLAAVARRKMPAAPDMGAGLFQFTSNLLERPRISQHPGLDTLTLQSRAVEGLLPLDRERAMILFRSIPLAEPAPSSTCDASTGDLTAYYLAAEAAYKKGFTAEERADGRDLDFLIALVSGSKSSAGLGGIMNFFRLPLDDAAYQRLLSAFTTALRVTRAEDSIFGVNITNALIQVIDRAQEHRASVFPLLAAVREFLVRSLSGARCAPPLPPDAAMPMEAEWFNDTLLSYGGNDTAQIRPIEAREVQPREPRANAALSVARPSEDAAGLAESARRLGAQPKGDRGAPPFEDTVRDLLRQINQWRRDHSEPETLYVTMAAGMYRQIATIVTSDTLRRAAIRDHLDLLRRTPLREQVPQAWATEVDDLLSAVQVNDVDLDWFREELRASGDPVMPLLMECRELLAMPKI